MTALIFDFIKKEIEKAQATDPVNAMIAESVVILLESFLEDVHASRVALEVLANNTGLLVLEEEQRRKSMKTDTDAR